MTRLALAIQTIDCKRSNAILMRSEICTRNEHTFISGETRLFGLSKLFQLQYVSVCVLFVAVFAWFLQIDANFVRF